MRSLQPATDSQSSAPTTVTSVSITSLAYSATTFGQAVVTVQLRTSGTALADVAIKITESNGSYGPGYGYGSGYGYGYGYGYGPGPGSGPGAGPGPGPGPGYPGTFNRTDHFAESGKLDYTVTDTFPVGPFCSQYGPTVAAAVSVSATVPGSTAAAMTATADLWAVHC
jgi:hypothetical protein